LRHEPERFVRREGGRGTMVVGGIGRLVSLLNHYRHPLFS